MSIALIGAIRFVPAAGSHLAIDLNELSQAETGQTLHARMQLLDDDGRVLAIFEGLQFKRVEIGVLQPPGLPNRVRQMLHEVVWRNAPPPREILPSEIQPLLSPDLARLVAQVGLDRYASFASRLNELVSLYIVKAPFGNLACPWPKAKGCGKPTPHAFVFCRAIAACSREC